MTMSAEDMVFTFCSNIVFVPWIALMFAPKWKYTTPITNAVVLISCLVYTISFGQHALNQTDGLMSLYANMGTLDGLSKMFSERAVLLPAWVHFLAFDLVAAHYVVQKNLKDGRGISKLAMAPCVFFFMMAGPVGMLMYVVIRNARDLIDGNSMNQKIV